MRINKADLDQMLEVLRNATDHRIDFSYDQAYGGYRLVRDGGSVNVSPRLSKPEMYRWMGAFIDGVRLITPGRVNNILERGIEIEIL